MKQAVAEKINFKQIRRNGISVFFPLSIHVFAFVLVHNDPAFSLPLTGGKSDKGWHKYAEPGLQFVLQLPFPDKYNPSTTTEKKKKVVFTCPVLKDFFLLNVPSGCWLAT